MENKKPTFVEIRKFLKPWLDVKTKWDNNIVKIYKSNGNIVVIICYSLIYYNTAKDRPMLKQIREYLIESGFDDEKSGGFIRKENLVD